jgi:purine nucleosidase
MFSAPLPVIIDTDPGVDDALALAFALRSGWFDVKAITVVAGNGPLERTVENAFRVLEMMTSDLENPNRPPIYRGADKPLMGSHAGADHVHGWDGLGGVCDLKDEETLRYPVPEIRLGEGHAAEAILEIVSRQPGEVTLITLGPLTNVALAARKNPAALSQVKKIVAMAGAFHVPGNVTPVAEYNVWADPDACREVLAFSEEARRTHGEDAPSLLRFVSLNVTHQVVLYREDFLRWIQEAGQARLGRFLLDCCEVTFQFHRDFEEFDGLYFHDPLAVMLAARPNLSGIERSFVDVECEGELTRGMTVSDLRGRLVPHLGFPAEVCVNVRAEEALALFRRGVFGE